MQNAKTGGMIIMVLILTQACSVKSPNLLTYDQNADLPPGFGYLIFGTHSPNPAIKVEFLSGVRSYVTPEFPAGHKYEMLLMPEGDYRMIAVYSENIQFIPTEASRFNDWNFTIIENKINYMGDLYLNGNTLQKYVDGKNTLEILNLVYPEVLNKHGVVFSGAE